MGGFHAGPACLLACAAVLFVSCASQSDKLDLARNEKLYHAPKYRAKVPADRTAFVAPVVDERGQAAVEEATGPYPMRWMAEGYWERPLPEMIDDCLRDALAKTAVFASLQDAPPPDPAGLVVEPFLIEARAGQEERLFGRRSLGTVSLRLVVHGPAAADGTREVLLEETFEQTVGTDISPQPQRVPAVLGRALEQAIARIVARIDQSNVARSGMPVRAATEATGR